MDKSQNTIDNKLKNAQKVSLFGEVWGFLLNTKKFWLVPILFCLLFFGVIFVLGGTGAAPFIYTLF